MASRSLFLVGRSVLSQSKSQNVTTEGYVPSMSRSLPATVPEGWGIPSDLPWLSMSPVERRPVNADEALRDLDPVDRVWLEERLVEYEELLVYLHDH
jgi:hypothetical protein